MLKCQLSLMPIYNENATLDTILTRVLAATLPSEISGIEIVAAGRSV